MPNRIRLIIFDLDGVLVDTRALHYQALNSALSEHGYTPIPKDVHDSTYDGLPTTKKLQMLGIVEKSKQDAVWSSKQVFTRTLVASTIKPNKNLIALLKFLKVEKGYTLYCASNSIWVTVRDLLQCSGALEFMDYFASNEEVRRPKPSPEIYLHCVARSGYSVHETMICEDSHIGRMSALHSGAHLCPVADPADLTKRKVMAAIEAIESSPVMQIPMDLRWKRPLRVVIPMAGLGSRFSIAGYAMPKPLIDVLGKPMIQRVVENLNVDAEFVFIVQRAHLNTYQLAERLSELTPNCRIVALDGVTDGAARTVLAAKEWINDSTPLLIANSDQFVEWNSNEFMYCASSIGLDGCVLTFRNPERENKWSFARTSASGLIEEIREKVPISDQATVGIYHWARGSDFVKDAEAMIAAGERVNGEFYVAPVYNYGIHRGLRFRCFDCTRMWGMGTPQDLEYFVKHYRANLQ